MIKELLPDIAFCETDTAAVEASLIAEFERITGRALAPGNPERLFVEAVAYLIAQQRFMIDYAGKMNLVSLSAGNYLDHLGAFLNTARLGKSYARTSLRFSLSASLAWDLAIPAGTRATADGSLFFATDAEVIVPAGQTTVDVPATCVEPGTVGNGLVPGQINRLVDRITYVADVRNLHLTLGGTDPETDERYRSRVRLAPERLSCCGPEGAYRYHAMSVSQDIIDVAVWGPEPGQVRVAPLMKGGAMPTAEIITAVNAAISSERTRPLTDVVQVVPPRRSTTRWPGPSTSGAPTPPRQARPRPRSSRPWPDIWSGKRPSWDATSPPASWPVGCRPSRAWPGWRSPRPSTGPWTRGRWPGRPRRRSPTEG